MSVLDHFPIIEVICKHLKFKYWKNLLLTSRKCAKFFKDSKWVKDMLKVIKDPYLELPKLEHQTKWICLEAVRKRGMALQFVRNQTEKICRKAVKNNGIALKYVQIQTLSICYNAIQEDYRAMTYVNYEFKKFVKK